MFIAGESQDGFVNKHWASKRFGWLWCSSVWNANMIYFCSKHLEQKSHFGTWFRFKNNTLDYVCFNHKADIMFVELGLLWWLPKTNRLDYIWQIWKLKSNVRQEIHYIHYMLYIIVIIFNTCVNYCTQYIVWLISACCCCFVISKTATNKWVYITLFIYYLKY